MATLHNQWWHGRKYNLLTSKKYQNIFIFHVNLGSWEATPVPTHTCSYMNHTKVELFIGSDRG